MPHFLGRNFPKLVLPTNPYCLNSSLLLWFGVLSIEPNPTVDILPETEKLATSAMLASKDPNADHPPFPSISESLSSLNHTSPERISPF